MNQSAIIPIPQAAPATVPGDSFTMSQWAAMLGVSYQSLHKRGLMTGGRQLVNGVLTGIYAFADLPQDYRARLESKKQECRCCDFAGLLGQIYAAPNIKGEKVNVFKLKEPTANTIWRRFRKIEEHGGIELAPLEAYLDGKSCDHVNQRLTSRLPREFQACIAALAVGNPGQNTDSSIWKQCVSDWQSGREIPGVEPRRASQLEHEFPYSVAQISTVLKARAPRTSRVMLTEGKHKSRKRLGRHSLDTSALRFAELLTIDDVRLDVWCVGPGGRRLPLWALVVMDVATRTILGFTLTTREPQGDEPLTVAARVLLETGVCAAGGHFIFERGTATVHRGRAALWEALLPIQVHYNRNNLSPDNLAPATRNDICRQNQAAALTRSSRERTALLLKIHHKGTHHANNIKQIKGV
jgi:hypothetical protein